MPQALTYGGSAPHPLLSADPELLHKFLRSLEDALFVYMCYQIESGAQVRAVIPKCFVVPGSSSRDVYGSPTVPCC